MNHFRHKSPWHGIDLAFAPMMDEHVVFVNKDGSVRRSALACVFLDGTGEPFSEMSMETDRQDILLVFSPDSRDFLSTLTRGDLVERPETCPGVKYSVQKVEQDYLMGDIVKAREINGR